MILHSSSSWTGSMYGTLEPGFFSISSSQSWVTFAIFGSCSRAFFSSQSIVTITPLAARRPESGVLCHSTLPRVGVGTPDFGETSRLLPPAAGCPFVTAREADEHENDQRQVQDLADEPQQVPGELLVLEGVPEPPLGIGN